MSFSIDQAFVVAVDGAVTLAAQDEDSVFRGTTATRSVTGKAWDVNTLGIIELAPNTTRHGDTVYANPDHAKRRGAIYDYDIAVLIDEEDELKTLINPRSEYVRELAMAQNRRYDRTVIAALNANVTTVTANGITESVNANGGVLTAFTGWDYTGNLVNNVNHLVANGSTGLTVAKVRQVKRLLDLQRCPQRGRHFVTSSYGIEDLLADPQVTSSDFAALRRLEAGSMGDTWMGFTWHQSDLLGVTTTSITQNFAWHERALEVATAPITALSVDKAVHKKNSIQVLAKASLGAVRKLENWVVQVDIDITA